MKMEGIKFYNCLEKPLALYGLCGITEEGFFRMPKETMEKMEAQMAHDQKLYRQTAGGRVRFKTDANKIVIKAKTDPAGFNANGNTLNHMNFDLYKEVGGKLVFETNFLSWEQEAKEGFLQVSKDLKGGKMTEYTLYMPCYGGVFSLELGFPEEARVEEPRAYTIEKPIVFLGSSITQGGCSSRPGLQYQGYVSRRLDADFVNLGFSGSCRAEIEIMEYVANLPMSAFVYDYDHNAPTLEHLEETHLRGYKIVREKNPELPIVLMSRPGYDIYSSYDAKRRITIQKTYQYGIENGDENLYYIDGYSLFEGEDRTECTVDGCHPNDIGMHRMGIAVSNALFFALNK